MFSYVLNSAGKLTIKCPTFREIFSSAHAAICDPVEGEAGASIRSEEADMLSEISFGL